MCMFNIFVGLNLEAKISGKVGMNMVEVYILFKLYNWSWTKMEIE